MRQVENPEPALGITLLTLRPGIGCCPIRGSRSQPLGILGGSIWR